MKNKKLTTLVALTLVLLLVLPLAGCAGTAPSLDTLNERFVYLIEESKELNTLFFGKGLPVFRRDESLSDRKMIYYVDEVSGYDRVMENSPYYSIDEMKAKAELVFSKDYLSDLYESAFDGIMMDDSSAYLRFYDNGEWLHQNTNAMDFGLSERIYDYSTMKIVEPSTTDYVNISIESYTLADPTRREVSLSFVYENGNWFLDSPTY